MKKRRITCEFDYIKSDHLQQIYTGFEMLAKKNIINLKIRYSNTNTSPILKVIVDNKFVVIYDTLDGFNWIDSSIANNLKYFEENLKCDYYFKRSYHKTLQEYNKGNRRIFPLGFNYYMNHQEIYISKYYNDSPKSKIKQFIKQQLDTLNLIKENTNIISAKVLEHIPAFNQDNKILFSTRLWNPEGTNQQFNKELRDRINQERIEFIRSCKKNFGDRFTGGLIADELSNKLAKDLVLPSEFSKKNNYLRAVKNHNICVATTGLHKSIGWKMGEYIAASRAIVSEKLNYNVPGNFLSDENYLEFNDVESLISQLDTLLSSDEKVKAIMNNNFNYYNSYLHPEKLILNTLKKLSTPLS